MKTIFSKNFLYKIKWFFQRIFQGYDNRNLWSLDYALAKWMLPQLIDFKKNLYSYPADMSLNEWENIIDKIIFSFKFIIADLGDDNKLTKKCAKDTGYDTIMAKFRDSHSIHKARIKTTNKTLADNAHLELKKLEETCQEGLTLFGKYLRSLWS